jgi:hypothetical protein
MPNLLLQKFPASKFTATTLLRFNAAANGEIAGLTIMGSEYGAIYVMKTKDGYKLIHSVGNCTLSERKELEICSLGRDENQIYLRARVYEGAEYGFSYSMDGVDYSDIGERRIATPGIWIGAKIGIFCINPSDVSGSGFA